jgi:hypothetical protein
VLFEARHQLIEVIHGDGKERESIGVLGRAGSAFPDGQVRPVDLKVWLRTMM